MLGLALRLDALDRAALKDVRSFALVSQAAWAGLQRVMTPKILSRARLRVRIHRVFGFRDPKKIQVKPLFPELANSQFYSAARNGVPFSLPDLSRRIALLPQGPAWVSWAEGRPGRVNERKRKIELDQEARVQRTKLLESELERRGIPFDANLGAVRGFCCGTVKTVECVVQAAEKARHERTVLEFVNSREAWETSEQVACLARNLKLDLKSDLTADLAQLPRSWAAPRALAGIWLRQHIAQSIAEYLERDLELRVGESLLREEDPDLLGEAVVWMRTAKALLTRYKRKLNLLPRDTLTFVNIFFNIFPRGSPARNRSEAGAARGGPGSRLNPPPPAPSPLETCTEAMHLSLLPMATPRYKGPPLEPFSSGRKVEAGKIPGKFLEKGRVLLCHW